MNNSGDVNYASIKSNIGELNKIVSIFEQSKPTKNWSKNDQLAFWINAYNVFTIKLITDNYPLKSIQNLAGGKTWDIKRIKINGTIYSLNDIENDIIRSRFKDARIHFALNCAAVSCPPLFNEAYRAEQLDSQLESQTKKFINNPKYQKLTSLKVTLSKIFDWYALDFGIKIDFLNKYSKIKIEYGATTVYNEYDWSLNDIKHK
ncbi:MAG: DUF547 domain-containing protein [Saprospiraceae bacterium]|nr:DUF547 domain-containing protein [Saprospiraceae bacterium]